MATTGTRTTTALLLSLQPLLNDWEELELQENVPGIFGYVLTLKTNMYIHRVHTRKDRYIPNSVYQSTSLTALPSRQFIEEWLKNARKAALTHINKGEYLAEIKLDGSYQNIKRKFNKWIWYDRKRNMLVGSPSPTTVMKG